MSYNNNQQLGVAEVNKQKLEENTSSLKDLVVSEPAPGLSIDHDHNHVSKVRTSPQSQPRNNNKARPSAGQRIGRRRRMKAMKIKCPVCGSKFDSATDYRRHCKQAHPEWK